MEEFQTEETETLDVRIHQCVRHRGGWRQAFLSSIRLLATVPEAKSDWVGITFQKGASDSWVGQKKKGNDHGVEGFSTVTTMEAWIWIVLTKDEGLRGGVTCL